MIEHTLIQLSPKPYGIHLITDEVLSKINFKGSGLLHLFIQHTSAALALNENVSSAVLMDMHDYLTRLVPESDEYRHDEEGPDDMPAHIKAVLCGSTLTIPYADNGLLLGQWQGIYLMEFRKNASSRSIVVSQNTF